MPSLFFASPGRKGFSVLGISLTGGEERNPGSVLARGLLGNGYLDRRIILIWILVLFLES
jgi:hypothetical protein